jgi:hypothetical protein
MIEQIDDRPAFSFTTALAGTHSARAARPPTRRLMPDTAVPGEPTAVGPAPLTPSLPAQDDEANGSKLVEVIWSAEWRKHFRRLSQLDEGPVPMLIESILIAEGATMLASLSGVGKTWLALAMAKALTTGKPFLGRFKVPTIVPVVYLVPEMGSRAIRKRAEAMGLPDSENFLVRTLKEGVTSLKSPYLVAMIREMKPVIFLDTAVRFIGNADENSSTESSAGLVAMTFELVRLGARAVVLLHHAPKTFAKQRDMTLENAVRGTGDFGAMCEVVWGIRHAKRWGGIYEDKEYSKESMALTRLQVECLKGRDIPEVADPFTIQGRPYLDETGEFAFLKYGDMEIDPTKVNADERLQKLVNAIAADPETSIRRLTKLTGWNHDNVKAHAADQGYSQAEGGGWVRTPPASDEKKTPSAP